MRWPLWCLTAVLLTVSGCLGGGTDVAVFDFELTAGPSRTVFPGASAQFAISSTAIQQGRESTGIALRVVSGLPNGAVATFEHSLVAPGTGTLLEVVTNSTTPPGDYNITIEGAAAGVVHEATAHLVVTGDEFGIVGAGASQSVFPGGTGTYSFTASLPTLRSDVQAVWTVTGGLPAGAFAAFQPAATAFGISTSLRVSTSGETPPGAYSIAVSATAGEFTKTAQVTLVVNQTPDFRLTQSGELTVIQGGSANATIGIVPAFAALGRDTSQVSLSVTAGLPVGMSASFQPATVGVGANSQLTISTNGTSVGRYLLTVTGTNLIFFRTTEIAVNVVAN